MQETIIHKKIQKHNERMHTSKVCCETLLLYIYIYKQPYGTEIR